MKGEKGEKYKAYENKMKGKWYGLRQMPLKLPPQKGRKTRKMIAINQGSDPQRCE